MSDDHEQRPAIPPTPPPDTNLEEGLFTDIALGAAGVGSLLGGAAHVAQAVQAARKPSPPPEPEPEPPRIELPPGVDGE
jgi:hypothetical protein